MPKVLTEQDARQLRLAEITQLMADVNVHLATWGFAPYRIGEHLRESDGRHVRKNYAGGEWVITISVKTRSDYKEVDKVRFDSRLIDSPLPSAEELALRLS